MTEEKIVSETPIVEKKKKKEKKPRGFAKVIYNQLNILNQSDYFKENHKEDDFKFLLCAKGDKNAAHVIIKDGSVKVEGIKKNEDFNIKKIEWDAYLNIEIETLFALTTGKPPMGKLLKSLIKREIRKPLKLLKLTKYMAIAAKEGKK